MVEIREDASEGPEPRDTGPKSARATDTVGPDPGDSSGPRYATAAQEGEQLGTDADGYQRSSSSVGPDFRAFPMNPIIFLKSRPVDTVLWTLRVLTLVFGFLYALPIIGGPQQQAAYYSKTLMAGAATNALRLHQRLGGFRLSRAFLSEMFLEDSCHYLFYCIIFLGSYPVTMALMPVFLFALLHAASFTVQMCTTCGMSGGVVERSLTRLVEGYSQNLLTVIASSEIFMMPMVIIMIFLGRGSILIPFIYYRFLSLRYMSRRNPNTRMAFYQMRLALEHAVSRPQCPQLLQRGAYKLIALIGRLCPTAAAG